MNYKVLKKNTFIYNGYSLIPIRMMDMECIRQWRNAQLDVLRQKKALTPNQQKIYFKNIVKPLFSDKQPNQLLFSFIKGTKLIGYGGLVHISWFDKRSEMSFLLDNSRAKNKKYYKEDMLSFISLIKTVCFDELCFNKLFVETYSFRDYHISILNEAGFIEEGRLRKHIFENGNYYDSIIHSILKEEYYEK